jgi:serine/threonine protein kinase
MHTTNRDEQSYVGPYRVRDRIGSGGYAEVFAGTDTRNGQRVALKRLRLRHSGDADSRERFRREGLALEAIDHPNIVRCFGILVDHDEVWIVMELLKGLTLRQLLRERGPLSVERALLIAIEVADGLADMHEMAIVHRDLKPENIFLAMPGMAVKVVDLGVAKFHGWSVPTTDPSVLVGTPSYAAPEITLGYPVDARSDIYALGLVLYEMLAGRSPFANDDGSILKGQDALTAHLVRTPPPLSSRRSDLPEPVVNLIAQMLAKDPPDRPNAMKVVARELRRALRTLRQARPLSGPPDSAKPALVVPAAAPQLTPPDLLRCGTPAPERRPPRSGPRPAGVDTAPRFLLPHPPEATTPLPRRTRDNVLSLPLPVSATTPAASEKPSAPDLVPSALLILGTMLIGGACGAVVSVRLHDLPQVPSSAALYALIVVGALLGVSGALLVRNEQARRGNWLPARPRASILAIGIGAGVLLGLLATWLLVAPLPQPLPARAVSVSRRPS